MAVKRKLSAGVGSNADGGNQTESGFVAFIFAFATPQAVLVIVASEITTYILNGATTAHAAGQGLAAFASLGPFGSGREEEVSHATACSGVHPGVVRLLTGDDDFYSCHTTPWW